ncbi:hypothetical protein L6452_38362 [Arctium lappa]|uniref:Uncharacterized protein n=1 Tax=Arctium lappa TaxID=4217 RepID=A0ACB8Y643_ARCLA|nr:hypothetical protein L6452_38362 [Arctium lappa]
MLCLFDASEVLSKVNYWYGTIVFFCSSCFWDRNVISIYVVLLGLAFGVGVQLFGCPIWGGVRSRMYVDMVSTVRSKASKVFTFGSLRLGYDQLDVCAESNTMV